MISEEERRAARALLDHAKAGGRLSAETITECLIVLGDLPTLSDEEDEPTIQRLLGVGEWESRHARHAAPATWLCGLA